MFGSPVKEALLRAEGMNLDEVRTLASARVFYLGSDTTRVFCLPTCHDARRIGAAHRQGFVTAAQAQLAGYRPCRRCRPA
jgi:methylphosphotriester-DNA--protein-cysteine methyltransferase